MSDRIFTNDLFQYGDKVLVYSESFVRMGFANTCIFIEASILAIDNITVSFRVSDAFLTDLTPTTITLPWNRVLALEPAPEAVHDRIERPRTLDRIKNSPLGKAAALVGTTPKDN